ncbi:MAG: hypoxanthine phosphoribosyltransferase [Limnochordia bacterium]|nr:hypoxanthine phosphoribosyltransferase [Limnochordia bacterium]MDI9465106.1 hypoxanthine phosphoribosyltransferase [Bacillota bacterium]NLO95384.1 hypoxanthine phosphoribosyltransferase [Bacillota bacterium]HAN94064.1 hypoxanthine phosphoribosyltransferase [Bacillota bacterium]HOB40874.1 hypoxanthine phosphoribosyltransferase [Limnochordia bacterium]
MDIVDRIIISEEEIQNRVRELGAAISRDYAGKTITLLCILKGGLMFLCDLAKHITQPVTYDFMSVSSYGDATETSGVVRITKDLEESIEGKHVLIVEDIIDTGLTLSYLLKNLHSRNPASLRICTLLDKPANRRVEIPIDYVGFEVPNEFLVGYGLDFKQLYRNIPFIFVPKRELIAD